MSEKPNFLILLIAQGVSVVGDSFGQRCSRVNYKHSTRHMMIGLCLMTAVQMFVIIGILQLALPTSITGAIYIDNKKVECYKELDIEGKIENCTPSNCTVIPCESQGPFSMFKSILLHPFLLTNGLMNIIYYNGEVFLYKEPLGLLFLVIAALSSTFLINPLNMIFGEPINQPIPALIYFFGITGSLLSVIEFSPKSFTKQKIESDENKNSNDNEKNSSINSGDGAVEENKNSNDNDNDNGNGKEVVYKHHEYSNSHKDYEESVSLLQDNVGQIVREHREKIPLKERVKSLVLRGIKILIPMFLLCIANALWMETTLFYNDQFRTNAFGYNSLDQILLPFYLFSFMLVIDLIKPLKKAFYNSDDQEESLLQAVKSTWKETSLPVLFIYRFLINGRAIMYFYLAIKYDLTLVYLELTLIRVVLNWLGAILLNLLVPKWINATAEEKRKAFHPVNIVLKCIGTVGVVVSLIILNK
ncbi:hypothetical protein DLAC_04335 [Tieghemostelium lacteum]|uniref:Transmembrane protein n=1 Tax=Tieghemostelium lacteum TaxID=361077 RepID=A0A151ZJJ9_TIELA|nr:hypothetical protein DLAC_04335 [Tieghemostelium lacteum]|eukprot:KYQ94060.1 hypothetical protein DLAC_04335 [Tieghemostelium lacteum]